MLLRAEPEAADRLWAIRFTDQIDFASLLPEIAIPTLLIHGERDVFTDRARMEYVASLIPRSKLVVMEGSGHVPAMTRPADVAASINSYFPHCSELIAGPRRVEGWAIWLVENTTKWRTQVLEPTIEHPP